MIVRMQLLNYDRRQFLARIAMFSQAQEQTLKVSFGNVTTLGYHRTHLVQILPELTTALSRKHETHVLQHLLQ